MLNGEEFRIIYLENDDVLNGMPGRISDKNLNVTSTMGTLFFWTWFYNLQIQLFTSDGN